MSEVQFRPGESFPLQFVWRVPKGGYLRAVFQAEVLELDHRAEKYVVRLSKLLAGRQDSEEGTPLPETKLEGEYWDLIRAVSGRRIVIAYEAADGRPLYLKLETLTGEHNYFTRYDNSPIGDSTTDEHPR
jgi:hypothetical protein